MATIVRKLTIENMFEPRVELVAAARQLLAEGQRDGFPKRGYIQLVDNKFGKALTEVKQYGKITFLAPQSIIDTAIFARAEVIKRSPILTGYYIKSHMYLFNGQPIFTDEALRAAVENSPPKTTDEIRLVNIAPYARTLEFNHGRSGGSIYKAANSAVVRKFGKVNFVSFRWMPTSAIKGLQAKNVRKRSKTKGAGSIAEALFPSIRIRRGTSATSGDDYEAVG